jgi:hypothetical protein
VKRLGLVALIAAVIAVACQNASRPPAASSSPTAHVSSGGWLKGSIPLDERVIQTIAGTDSPHCGRRADVFLVMGWPLGQRVTAGSPEERWYVRNPTNELKLLNVLLADYVSVVTPPADASYTNYHNSIFELWVAPSDQDTAAYIKTGGHFERWPRSKYPLWCV